jgi:spore maturation protein CgeB
MRMFEIMGCGATLLNSKCPELEGEFPNSVATFYYSDRSSLISTVEDIFGNEDRLLAVRETGRSMVLRRHTYTHRAESLLRCLQLS